MTTVGELKKALKEYPDHMDVYIPTPDGEFEVGPVERITKKTIRFSETPNGRVLAHHEVVFLDNQI